MAKNDFKALLDSQIKKASTAVALEDKRELEVKNEAVPPTPPEVPEEKQPTTRTEKEKPVIRKTSKSAAECVQGRNINRVTVNLFEADSRALSVIREKLGGEGHDFSSRSDSIKIGLRLAARAKPDELAKLFEQVKSEDRRFKAETE